MGDADDEALIEVCVGLGESLVSNSPGRALSATVSKRLCGLFSRFSKILDRDLTPRTIKKDQTHRKKQIKRSYFEVKFLKFR